MLNVDKMNMRLGVFVLLVYCGYIGYAQIPTITNFSSASGPIGTVVTITGNNFNGTPSNNIAYFGATRATVTTASSTQLTCTVPIGATFDRITVTKGGLTPYSLKPVIVTFPVGPLAYRPKVDYPVIASPRNVGVGSAKSR